MGCHEPCSDQLVSGKDSDVDACKLGSCSLFENMHEQLTSMLLHVAIAFDSSTMHVEAGSNSLRANSKQTIRVCCRAEAVSSSRKACPCWDTAIFNEISQSDKAISNLQCSVIK